MVDDQERVADENDGGGGENGCRCGVEGHARGRVKGREGVYVGVRRADGQRMQLRRGREMRRVEEHTVTARQTRLETKYCTASQLELTGSRLELRLAPRDLGSTAMTNRT